MTGPLSPASIGQVARGVRNIAEATAWYRDTLGLTFLFDADGMAFFDLGGTRLYLQQTLQPGPESILYFLVADIEAAHAALLENGVTMLRPPHIVHRHADGTEEWLAFFGDPEGRPLALMSRLPPAGEADNPAPR